MKLQIITGMCLMLSFSSNGYSQHNSNLNHHNMFTLDQIKEAHSKVKTGADFPAYVQELKKLGLIYYDNYVTDGHTEYYGKDNYHLTGSAKYEDLLIADESDKVTFLELIKIHQQGGSDYSTICHQAAENGIEKWRVDLQQMTCTYYNKKGDAVIVETIPEP